MKKLMFLMTMILSFNLFACPSTHKEFPDNIKIDRIMHITSPIFLTLNTTISYPIFENELNLFQDTLNFYSVTLISKNGPQDHEQIFTAFKLRPVISVEYGDISTENLFLDIYYPNDKTYGDFKLDTQGLISFCYEAKSPIEYR